MEQTTFWQDVQRCSDRYWQRWQNRLGTPPVGTSPYWSVVIIGRPGVGKSTLLRHLIHPLTLATGPTCWPVSVLTPDPPILWTDTPGWTPEQTPVIQQALVAADLCLWLVTPGYPPELEQLLRDWGRPVIRVVPWGVGDLSEPDPPLANCIATVVVRLFPGTQRVRTEWPDGRGEWSELPLPVDVSALQTLVSEVLQYRVAIRCVNQLLVLARREREWVAQQRQTPLPWGPVVVKALAMALTPGLLLKLAVSWLTDLWTVVWLSRAYQLPITRHGIERLVVALGLSSGAIGLASWAVWADGGFALFNASLWGALTGYGVQRVTRAYLQQGLAWAPDGPRTLLERIYRQLRPGNWLHTWVGHCLHLVGDLS
ncbi:MAG: GTPase domain-containing protein [Gloeomargarita sp. SKYBB_i_bin120]|nr:GTPase domain-containing protein [Gloeomargarita sp. SKYG98]MCS7292451.1 GTPase domain-containing protein [Gloeomargarita sp. SKYB120]MDW8178012.1 GTPase domain-containing protein [Gloeomargarita sp. SKYBB_i_bin120]